MVRKSVWRDLQAGWRIDAHSPQGRKLWSNSLLRQSRACSGQDRVAQCPAQPEGKQAGLRLRISRKSLTICWALQCVDCLHRNSANATEKASRCPGLQRRQQTVGHACVAGEAVNHRGGAEVERVESDNAARSVGGSHSVRKQASTTTGADRRWL